MSDILESLRGELARVEKAYCVKRAERECASREMTRLWEARASLLYKIALEESVVETGEKE